MRFIPTRIHGFLDYGIGVLLIASPWLLGFAVGGAETWVPVAIGILIIAYSLMTDYELGLVRRIPMSIHLWLDGLVGIFLAWSPTIFGFSGLVWVPHVLLGSLALFAALFTQPRPVRRYWPT
jgi:hypothetical protein